MTTNRLGSSYSPRSNWNARVKLPEAAALLISTLTMTIALGQPSAWTPWNGTGAITPTVSLSQSSGAPGDSITVSGTAAGPFSLVRIMLLEDRDSNGFTDCTRSLAVTPVVGGSYSTPVLIPSDLTPASLRIGAAVVGSSDAAVASTPFALVAAAAARVYGAIAEAATGAARLELYDRATGAFVSGVDIAGNGSFDLSGIPTGTYSAAIVGEVNSPVQLGGLIVLDPDEDEEVIAMTISDSCMAQLGRPTVTHVGASPTQPVSARSRIRQRRLNLFANSCLTLILAPIATWRIASAARSVA